MERTILRVLMIALGAGAILIGASIFLLGATFTGGVAEALANLTAGGTLTPTPRFSPTVESELRFYAPFWVTYGGILIWVARSLESRLKWVPPLAALFFAGGVGRLIAYFADGPPHAAFVQLMAIELILPPVFVALWRRIKSQSSPAP